MGTMCVPSMTLCPTFKGWEWEYLVFERDWSQECYHGNDTMAAILFFCDVLVPSLKNTAPIFLKMFLNQCFILNGTVYDI